MGSLSAVAVGLSAPQRAMVDIIEREFTAAGYSLPVTAAAVVNAYAESGLNPLAIGDSGNSVGLFQLNIRGAGAGMSVAQRQDATTNARTLLARERPALAQVTLLAQSGASLGQLAAAFAKYVERPRYPDAEGVKRAAYALRLFPLGVAPAAPATVGRSTPSATERSTNAALLWGAVALASIGLLASLHAHSKSTESRNAA